MIHDLCDRINEPLYDTGRIDPGVRTEFFSVPVGMGRTHFGNGAKHFGDTNAFLAGQLPGGQQFAVGSIYAETISGGLIGLEGADLQFVIGCKRFLGIPLSRVRLGLHVGRNDLLALGRIEALLRDVAPAGWPMLLGMVPGLSFGFVLERQLVIRSGEHFEVTVCAPENATPAVVRLYLNGELSRPIQ